MTKKFIITESEKNQIRQLYQINEIDSEKVLQALAQFVDSASSSKPNDTDSDVSNKSETDYDTSSSSGDNWMDVTKKVIAKFEGGYWNPKCAKYPGSKHPSQTGMYRNSGETMFGLDRKAGNIQKVSSDGKRFFDRIDDEKKKLGMKEFCRVWKWNYIPEDPLKSELMDLAAKTMKTLYESNASNFFKGKTRKVVESSRPLLLHFSYATWNGPKFFKDFAKTVNKAIEEGKPIDEIVDIVKQDRTNSIGGAWAEGTKRVNAAIDQEASIDGVA